MGYASVDFEPARRPVKKNDTPSVSNLFASLPAPAANETFAALAESSDTRVERIVSHGHSTPPGTWLRSNRDEWVILLRGSAALNFRGSEDSQKEIPLGPGDWLTIPAGVEHRVTRTDTSQPTVWLAVHFRSDKAQRSLD